MTLGERGCGCSKAVTCIYVSYRNSVVLYFGVYKKIFVMLVFMENKAVCDGQCQV